MMNTMMFCVSGYDDDPREIHMIPAVRNFYKAFHQQWPYWFFFCNLDNDNLKSMTFSCLNTMDVLQFDNQQTVGVRPDPQEMADFMSRSFGAMNLICNRANIFEALIYRRSKAIMEYYGLPDEAGSPES